MPLLVFRLLELAGGMSQQLIFVKPFRQTVDVQLYVMWTDFLFVLNDDIWFQLFIYHLVQLPHGVFINYFSIIIVMSGHGLAWGQL